MVDAGERRPDEAKPPEKGDRVKSAPIIALPWWLHKTDSLRAQQAVARYGKAARHPLCLAALDLLRLDEEFLKCTEKIELSEELVKRTKQMKENAQALIKQFHKERNEKKANQVSALLRKIDQHLLKAQTRYQLLVKLRSKWQEIRPVPLGLFKREYERVIRTGDVKACRALQRLRKRWLANEADLKAGDLRKLEMLNLLRDQVIKAKWTTGEATFGFGYWDRPLSDEEWQGRLTARKIHSHIAAARGFVSRETRMPKRSGGLPGNLGFAWLKINAVANASHTRESKNPSDHSDAHGLN